mgnify:CR=1 FL=1
MIGSCQNRLGMTDHGGALNCVRSFSSQSSGGTQSSAAVQPLSLQTTSALWQMSPLTEPKTTS